MLQIHHGLFYVVFMIVLLGCSAFFSGSETALFSLSRNLIKTMRQSKHRLEHLVVKLLQKPEQLLGSLLLGNLMISDNYSYLRRQIKFPDIRQRQ